MEAIVHSPRPRACSGRSRGPGWFDHLLWAPTRPDWTVMLIRERTVAEVAAVIARGRHPGRKPALSAEQLRQARAMIASGEPKAAVARTFRVGRTTLYRHLAGVVSAETDGDVRAAVAQLGRPDQLKRRPGRDLVGFVASRRRGQDER